MPGTLAACRWFALAAAVVGLSSSGCGAAKNRHALARLEGRVTVDEKPVVKGSVQFLPAAAGQAASAEIVDGHYLAKTVPIGKVRVLFTAVRETGKMINEGGHVFPDLVSVIPEQYQQGIDLDVTGDNLQQDFILKSQ